MSLTSRRLARRLQYVTGHGVDGRLPADFDWQSLADPSATTVIYMPAKTLGEFSTAAIAHGLDPATPAVAVIKATRPDEAVIAATVESLPARLSEQESRGPVIVMIGRALADCVATASEPQRHSAI